MPQIAVGTKRIRRKRGRIQELAARRRAVIADSVGRGGICEHQIGAIVIEPGERVILADRDIQGLAARSVNQWGDLPIAQ